MIPSRKQRNPEVIRMALLIQERLAEAQELKPLRIPESNWQECQRLARLAEKAISHGWFGAARRIRPRLTQALRELKNSLDGALAKHLQLAPPPCPSLKELHAELLGLMDEFPNTDFDLRGETLSVTTHPVILDEVYLGPFRIALDVNRDGEGLDYSVVATDPMPAAKSEEVTHPHVQNDRLCEGDGRMPIQNALREGRLGDFFQIVTQILHTYNPASAYVALDEWEGISCVSCGGTASDDERTSCSASGETICCECAVTCPDCDGDFSSEYTSPCDECEERFCDRCLEQGLCHDCQEEARQEEAQTEQQTETRSGRCGGEAAVVAEAEVPRVAVG